MSDPVPELKMNRKKLENLERLKKKKEAKVSKSKQRKLTQIAERKKHKQTLESLLEEMQHYQLDAKSMELLASTSGRKSATQRREDDGRPLKKKLRCVGSEQLPDGIVKRKQRDYIETDESSSEADHDGDEIEQRKAPENGTENLENTDEKDVIILDEPQQNRNPSKELIFEKPKQIVEEAAENSRRERKKMQRQAEKNYLEILSKIKGERQFPNRDESIEQQRRQLPINGEEQPIVEAINEAPVVIICGETGSGKTTQVPQFCYEAGYTSNGHLIGVTEPRRIAAMSMANRVGVEMAAPELSSYQIRYEGNRTDKTKILFMTDGVLLKELQADCTLSKFSVIIIDEAHERSIYSDVLIGLLSRICLARLRRKYPLKLIIMSATLRLNDFLQERLFPQIRPKVLSIESRQFPVSIYYERRTPKNYLEATFKKVCKIHEQYPSGAILVFLSGQNEVNHLIKLLERRYSNRLKKEFDEGTKAEAKQNRRKRTKKRSLISTENEAVSDEPAVMDYDEYGIYDMDDDEQGAMAFADLDDDNFDSMPCTFPPLICLPLYSLLPAHLQRRVFESTAPDNGSRVCVVATNVAETSLTIPNIRYVVDSGKEKRRDYDPITGVSRFLVGWCSKASANQRSGRAGRLQSGHTFRLYSSAIFEDMPTYPSPEILNKPIEQLVLFLKSMGFAKIANFPFPTPPRPDQITAAEARLIRLGALTAPKNKYESSQITPLGTTLVQIPLEPGFAKMLVCSFPEGLLPFAISLVSALSVREPIIPIGTIREATNEETQAKMTEMLKQRRSWCSVGEAKFFGDLTVLLSIVGAADYKKRNDFQTFRSLGLLPKAFNEICKLRSQLVTILNKSESLKEKLPAEFRMKPPSQEQFRKLRQILVSCFPEKIAMRVDEANTPKGAYKTQILEEFVFIDSASMLFKEQPDFVLYQEIIQVAEKKVMQNVVIVEREWIPNFVNFHGILGKF